MNQLSIDFNPDITKVYPTALRHLRMRMEDYCAKQNKNIDYLAVDMGITPNSLYKKMSENENCKNKFTLADFEAYLTQTGDVEPIKYLVSKYMAKGADSELERALARIAELEGK